MIYVANIKTYRAYDAAPGATVVYIGRAMPGRPGSVLGNPFKLTKGESREACFEKYRKWVREQDPLGPVWNEIHRLARIAQHSDLVLLCWCAPELCHGDVVRELIEDEWEQPRGFFKPQSTTARPAPAGSEEEAR